MDPIKLRARLTRPYWSRRFGHLGKGAIVHRPVWVHGPHLMSIGDGSLILHGASLSVESFAFHRTEPVLRIGARVGMRPYCTISAAESVIIEDDVIVGAFTGIVDSDHTFSMGRPNVMHNPVETSPVRIGRGTWIAERVAVLRGASIGCCCIVGANSVVRGTIPDYSIAVGAPARVVGRVEGVDGRAEAFASTVVPE
jgi:carbonic anhydrase/acetyltransferase-like protein (isoleucine patch superfamily)